MRSNPFATSFGKKTEERHDDPGSSAQPGQGRSPRLQDVIPARPPGDDDLAIAEPPPRNVDPADPASPSPDAPVDANTLAALRSWGLPDPEDPRDPDSASDPLPRAAGSLDSAQVDPDLCDPAAADRDDARSAAGPASSGAGASIDRLREELGVDNDRAAGRQRGEASESDVGAPCGPSALSEGEGPVEGQGSPPAPQAGEAQAAPAAGPARGRRIAPPAAAPQAPPAAPEWNDESEDSLTTSP